MSVTKAVRPEKEKFIFIFIRRHDAEQYISTISLGNKLLFPEGKRYF